MLQKVELPIVSKDRCRGLYGDLPDHQICAGNPETGGKDSCQVRQRPLAIRLLKTWAVETAYLNKTERHTAKQPACLYGYDFT
jgi:hypothetical protein